MAESQAQFNQQAAMRAAAGSSRVEPVPRTPTTSAFAPFTPSQTTPQASPTATTAGSSTWFQSTLVNVRDNAGRLIPELQRSSSAVARQVLDNVFQVSAESNAMIIRIQNGEPFASILPSYQALDVRWRDVSFRLRSGGAVDARVAPIVDAIDETFRNTDRQLGITPPIDRVRMRDLMIVTLTFMDAMFDDIRLSPGAFGQADALLRDGRVLRERLRKESYKIDRADYNEVSSSYTDFVLLWRAYSARLYQLNDAHVNQRLESIRRQGDEVYASLRIPAATDRRQLQFAAQRLTASLVSLQQEFARWGANRLPADQQRFADTVNQLVDRSRRLETQVAGGSASSGAVTIFNDMDRFWINGLKSMRAVDPRSGLQQSLVQVDTLFGEVRDLWGAGPSQSQTQLLTLAASLEVTADDFNNDVQRFKRYFTPVTFRESFGAVADDLAASTRELHRVLEDPRDTAGARRLASRIVDNWQRMTPMLGEVTQRGLTPGRAESLFENYRVMHPLVAEAATLLTN